ncbi:hypothetical protein EDD22DRAFT_844482 [Suillus occidentalis]|nr:hypothetical protein EDD22DRAFT_844482 [Suillus occidentalis]
MVESSVDAAKMQRAVWNVTRGKEKDAGVKVVQSESKNKQTEGGLVRAPRGSSPKTKKECDQVKTSVGTERKQAECNDVEQESNSSHHVERCQRDRGIGLEPNARASKWIRLGSWANARKHQDVQKVYDAAAGLETMTSLVAWACAWKTVQTVIGSEVVENASCEVLASVDVSEMVTIVGSSCKALGSKARREGSIKTKNMNTQHGLLNTASGDDMLRGLQTY